MGAPAPTGFPASMRLVGTAGGRFVTHDAADPRPRRVNGDTGFTVTELLTVVGLIALIVSLLLPVVAKARAAAHTTACLSNLRQMGTALIIYSAENRAHAIEYMWFTPNTPD